jgi:hypothetical protein
MFQYAFAYALSLKYSAVISVELSLLQGRDQAIAGNTPRRYELDVFGVCPEQISKGLLQRKIRRSRNILYRLLFLKRKISCIEEEEFGFFPEFVQVRLPVYLNGYFQSEDYFLGFNHEIKKLFTFPDIATVHSHQEYLQSIQAAECPVSVHFRRGDYVTDPVFNNNHGVCSFDYYNAGMRYIHSKHPEASFYFFSDDIDQIEKEFSDSGYKIVFVKTVNTIPAWVDMMLMSKCHHHVIANSSYSWWGAWLADYKNKIVVAPDKWFADTSRKYDHIIPAGWEVL